MSWLRPETCRKQRHARGVQIDADEVDAARDDGFERLLELFGVDVVLIQADADILRLDLDEFGERVLEPAADRDRAAQGGVEFGKFLATDGAGGVDAGAGLVDDDVSQFGELFVRRMGRRRGRRRLGTRRSGSVLLGLSLGTFGQADKGRLGRTGHAAGRRRRFRFGFGRVGRLVRFRSDRRGFRFGFGDAASECSEERATAGVSGSASAAGASECSAEVVSATGASAFARA